MTENRAKIEAAFSGLKDVVEAGYDTDEQRFLAFFAECCRIRREIGHAAFTAGVDEMLAL